MKKPSICPACTLLCDDIEITAAGSTYVANGVCQKGQAFFEIERIQKRVHCVDGQPQSQQESIAAAATILCRANAPLICGLENFPTQTQQLAWKVADVVGANVDSTLSNDGRASMFALQRRGKVTASFGEIANRSDLVVFWFCDPVKSHPRLLERLKTTGSPSSRKLIVIDEAESKTSMAGDKFIQLNRTQAPKFLASLRGSLRGLDLPLAGDEIAELASAMSASNYGAIFHGQVSEDSAFELASDALNCLISELNDITRFVGMKLRKDSNAQSAENVLAWSSGFPFAINLARKFPRYNFLEHSAETILTRGECDAVLFATGVDIKTAFSRLSRTALNHLGSIPKIAFSPIADFQSDVRFHVEVPGIGESGEFCRNDDVSMPLRVERSDPDGSTEQLIQGLLAACESQMATVFQS